MVYWGFGARMARTGVSQAKVGARSSRPVRWNGSILPMQSIGETPVNKVAMSSTQKCEMAALCKPLLSCWKQVGDERVRHLVAMGCERCQKPLSFPAGQAAVASPGGRMWRGIGSRFPGQVPDEPGHVV